MVPAPDTGRARTRLVFWTFVVIGITVGVDAFGASSQSEIAVGLLEYLPKLIGAGVILLVGNIVARFLSRGVLIGAVNMNLQYARLLSLGVKWMVLALTTAMALDHLRIGERLLTWPSASCSGASSCRCHSRWGWVRATW